GPDTFQVCRLLHHLFDLVFVETVGIGQSEVDVRWLADRMYLVLQPLGGDEIQMLKAGIMEVPDAIVVNKCDEAKAARRLLASLTTSLPLSRPFGDGPPAVLQTSGTSRGRPTASATRRRTSSVAGRGSNGVEPGSACSRSRWAGRRTSSPAPAASTRPRSASLPRCARRWPFDARRAHGATLPTVKQTAAKAPYKPRHHLRIVTAASLFDGHDASIN